jgi:hypothetical protein
LDLQEKQMNNNLLASVLSLIASLLIALSLFGCRELPQRPNVYAIAQGKGCEAELFQSNDGSSTPEIHKAPNYEYTLHFLEFTDQGWAYPVIDSRGNPSSTLSNRQIDCAIGDLASRLNSEDIRAFVYVHGWHHSAKDHDRDLERFQRLLKGQAIGQAEINKATGSKRAVIGFYIGWRGDSVELPFIKDVTFWGRKNAAHHVSEGSVREFFSRIKAIRNHWNRRNTERSKNCGKPEALTDHHDCPLRTVMIGHSFGAWVLYSATSPYLLETLAGTADLPEDASLPVTARERGIADLIVLLNPAFEASRYEPIYRAAMRYKNKTYESPLLVSITSTSDLATKYAFPLARFFNSIFQYPTTSDEESEAIKRTHGHVDRYITHLLKVDLSRSPSTEDGSRYACMDESRAITNMQEMRDRFIKSNLDSAGNFRLESGWTRQLCGGLTLEQKAIPGLDPYNVVWNIQTDGDVIQGHNGIVTIPLWDFVTQIYEDIRRIPKLALSR